VKITADTNILVRALTDDDPAQSPRAQAELAQADLVAIPSVALCELVWVLTRGYRMPAATVADAIRRLLAATDVAADRRGAEAGLAMLDAGGDLPMALSPTRAPGKAPRPSSRSTVRPWRCIRPKAIRAGCVRTVRCECV